MKYGIIGAMDEEISYLLREMTSITKVEVANCEFYEGKIDATNVVLLKSGIGKVNAAMATTILMERFHPDYVINTGSAGGFNSELSVGDIVISDEVVYHDVDATAFDYEYGQVPRLPATFKADQALVNQIEMAIKKLSIQSKIGLIATGDTFMSDPVKINVVREIFPKMLAAEMEGAAIAQVCYQYDVPFVIIRALSDIAGKDSPVSFDEFLALASKNSSELILSILKK